MQEFSAFGRSEIEGEERRPVLLLCHGPVPAPTPAMGGLVPLEAALDHLTGLGVSSVLMLLESRLEVELLVRRSLLDPGYHDLFFLDVGGGTGWVFFLDTGLLNLDDSGRLWHMRGDTQSLALPFGPLVRRIEELVNPGASTGNAAEPTRLAMVYGTEDEFDRELFGWLADDISTPLSINTTSFVEELLQYNRILIIDKDHEDEERRSMEEQVANFGAHIVLFFTGNEALVPKLERAYADAGARPPFYVFGSEFTRRPSLLGHVDIESLLPARTRMIGLNFASADDPTLYQAYRLRISAIAPGLYENVNEWRVKPFATVYDATYYLVYAAVAGGPGGLAKAAGFRRLISGPRHEIGPGGIESVVARLSRADTTVSLSGPSGDFPFHAPTGGRIAFSNAWCIDEGPIDNDFLNNLEYVFDVLRYDNALRDFTGTITCFDP
jgi:hypothetical protein